MKKEKDKVITNTAVQVIGKVLTSVLTFATTYLTIKVAGADIYGNVAKVTALFAIGYAALDFGINAHVVRELEGKSKKEKKALITNTFALRVLLSLVVIAVLSSVVWLLPQGNGQGYTSEVKMAFVLGSATILLYGLHLSSNAIFQHELKYERVVAPAFLGALTMFVLSYLVLMSSPRLIYLVLAIGAGYIVTASSSLIFAKEWITRSPKIRSALRIGKAALPLGLVLILSTLASKSDTVILGVFRLAGEVGEYNFAYKVFDFALVLPVFAMNALYPVMLKREEKTKLANKASLNLGAIGVVGAVFLFLLSPLLVLVRPELTTAITSLKILSLSLPLFYVTAPLMWQFVAEKKEKYLIYIYSAAALFNILGNLYLAPTFGAVASASLTILTELGILITLLYARNNTLH